MTENKEITEIERKPIGRPKTLERDKAKYRTHAFYFPLRIEEVFAEFDFLCRKEFSGFNYPERSKSIKIRNMILDYVSKNTKKENLKLMIQRFKEEYLEFVEKQSNHGVCNTN